MMKRLLYLFLLLVGSVAYGQRPIAEQILSFHSDIAIAVDGTVAVTEHIRVHASGDQIKRGIVRRLPLTRTDRNGVKQKIDVEVLSVSCNGSESDYRNEHEDNMRVIYVGNKDVILSPGEYTYAITYSSRGHVGFFDDYDELYWNVTGNDWDFAIGEASATVTLPEAVSAISTACYTGAYGQAEKNCEVDDKGNAVYFRTTASLSKGEGLTVAVSFPRGIIERPAPPTALELFWQKYWSVFGSVVCLLILLVYCWITWNKVGRDPRKPVVIPTFRPPHDWSAGMIRYLFKRKSDDRAFTAALVSMAVKKAIHIDCVDKKYTLRAKERVATLSEEEQALYDTLFKSAKTLAVSDKNHVRFADATLRLEKALSEKVNLADYYLKNLKYIGWGALVTVVVQVFYILMSPSVTDAGIIFFAVPLVAVFLLSLFGIKALPSASKGCFTLLFWIFFLLPMGLMAIGAVGSALMFLASDSIVTAVFVFLVWVIYGFYVWLIKAPTPLGAKTSAELEGFRMYLKAAEEHRLNLLTPPEQTPELFERMLPYAIALNVENEWGRKFEAVLARYNYEPDWYKGTEPLVYGALVGSFASSIGSARIDPTSSSSSSSSSGGSWSSGSSGGGFSGGGGGGGGGGGW